MTVGDLIMELVTQSIEDDVVMTTFDVNGNNNKYKNDIMIINYEDGTVGIVGI